MSNGILRALLLSCGPIVTNAFARFAYALVLPAMRTDQNWSWSQAGLMNTAGAVGYLVGAGLTRMLVSRTGNRRLFQVGVVATAMAIVATGMTARFEMLALLRLFAGASGATAFICGGALSGNLEPNRPAIATTCISIYYGGIGIGFVFVGIFIPLILEASGDAGWPAVWTTMGYVAMAMAVLAVWIAEGIQEPGNATKTARWQLRPFLPVFISFVLFGGGFVGYMTFVIAWMRGEGASKSSIMTTWSVLGVVIVIAPLVWTKMLERHLGGQPMAVALGCAAAGTLIPLLSTMLGWMVVSAAFFGSSLFLVVAAATSLIKHGCPKQAWGAALATFTFASGVAQIIAPVAIGWLADVTGSLRLGLAASAALLALGGVIALAQRNVLERTIASP